MASDAPRFFNVWLVQSNMVYRGVPYTVVCDWIQEGRLTAKDCVRTAEESNWRYIGDHELFSAYLAMPQATPRPDDAAEALGDVELDFSMRKQEEGEEDPDMIPLIDISMVLLVFFMMTAENLLTRSPVDSPKAAYSEIADNKSALMANIQRDPDNPKRAQYFFGDDFSPNAVLTDEGLVQKLEDAIRDRGNTPQIIIIRADGLLPYETVSAMTVRIQKMLKQIGNSGTRIKAQVRQKSEGGS
jgi:biopolymer transport protein ExbD